jgi:hypothetical protein
MVEVGKIRRVNVVAALRCRRHDDGIHDANRIRKSDEDFPSDPGKSFSQSFDMHCIEDFVDSLWLPMEPLDTVWVQGRR